MRSFFRTGKRHALVGAGIAAILEGCRGFASTNPFGFTERRGDDLLLLPLLFGGFVVGLIWLLYRTISS